MQRLGLTTYLEDFDWSRTPLGAQADWSPALRTAFDIVMASGFGMCLIWGPEHTLLYNHAYAPFLGKRHPGALGQPMAQVWHDIWPDIAPLVDRTMAGETVHLANMHLVMTRNGYPEDTYWTFSYSPVHDDGAIAGFLNVTHDTTPMVTAQERDRINAERVQLALGAGAIIGTWFWDLPTDCFTVDAAFARSFGLDPALGHSGIPLEQIIATVHPDDRGGLIAAIDAVIARGGAYAHQYRVRRQDGHYYWIEANGRVDQDADGKPTRFPGVLIDVEERRVVEAERDRAIAMLRTLNEELEQRVEERTRELRDSMDFARLALSAVGGVGVWTYEVASDLFTCDENISRIYDIDPVAGARGIARADFLANVHPDDRADLRATMSGGLVNPGDLELEYRVVHQDGSVHWVLSRGHTYFDEAGAPVRRTGVGVDMTKPRMVEEQLRQAQKMEAVGQLTGGIAHDFNNLLQGITGSLEVIQRRIAQGRLSELDRFVAGATAAANRAAALTHRLLAFSRRQPLDPRPVRINGLIASMEDLIRRTIGESVDLELVLAGGLWTTRCDPNQLENAILNLAINARDAMPQGGKLTIETGNAHLDQAYAASQSDVTPGQYVCIGVTDTGTGMTADVIAKAFEPFFTTKPIGQGTGLGLSMIYGFAQQSEGYAKIYSEIGQGTSFKLYLPRHRGEAPDEEPAQRPSAAPASETGEIVLVVEDEAVVRGLIVEELKELGYVPIEAVDGAKGLEILRSSRRIDLLVTDIGLPGLNGRQVADAARALRPGLKVLFMTGYAENAALASGFLEPGMAMITKPFAMEALATRIRGMIEAPGTQGAA
jgi:signal transduction histidine kinase/CheY-like chemotaxis protein